MLRSEKRRKAFYGFDSTQMHVKYIFEAARIPSRSRTRLRRLLILLIYILGLFTETLDIIREIAREEGIKSILVNARDSSQQADNEDYENKDADVALRISAEYSSRRARQFMENKGKKKKRNKEKALRDKNPGAKFSRPRDDDVEEHSLCFPSLGRGAAIRPTMKKDIISRGAQTTAGQANLKMTKETRNEKERERERERERYDAAARVNALATRSAPLAKKGGE